MRSCLRAGRSLKTEDPEREHKAASEAAGVSKKTSALLSEKSFVQDLREDWKVDPLSALTKNERLGTIRLSF
jgi:hypothetical protein